MRKLIVSNILSLDGFYEGPEKNVMALFAAGSRYAAAGTCYIRWFQEFLAVRGRLSRRHANPKGDITAQ
jgi:hypothetical protein